MREVVAAVDVDVVRSTCCRGSVELKPAKCHGTFCKPKLEKILWNGPNADSDIGKNQCKVAGVVVVMVVSLNTLADATGVRTCPAAFHRC